MGYIKFSFLLFFSALTIVCHGQKAKVMNDPTHDLKPVHFGFSIGLNTQDYNIEPSQFSLDTFITPGIKEVLPGFDVHAIANFRLATYLDVRLLPGISLGQKRIYYEDKNGKIINEKDGIIDIEASCIEIPVLLKYKAKRLNNVSPYIIGGLNTKWDLTAKQSYGEDQQIIVNRLDYFAEMGAGFDFYLEYFKMGLEIKYGMGLTNILKTTDSKGKPNQDHPEYTDLIESIRSQAVVISIHFE